MGAGAFARKRAIAADRRPETKWRHAPSTDASQPFPLALPPRFSIMPRILFALALAVSLAAPAAAQSKLVPADSAEVANHQVTEAELARVAAIVQSMDRVYQTDPRAFVGLEWKTDGPLTLDFVAARFEAKPAMRAELDRAGMTGREFVLPLFALVNARNDAREDPSRLGAARAANLRLAESRGAEIGRLFTILRTVGRED